jgi:flagellar assembly factor FliW
MAITSKQTSGSPLDIAPASGDQAVLTFSAGLPGFPEAHRFVLEGLGDELEPFCRMRCLDQRDLTFTVMPPGLLFADYAVTIDEESVERLGITDPEDATILAIVTLAVPPEPPKVNLLGPLVVNRHSLAAAQVVQHGSAHGVAVPLVAAGA